VALTVETSMLDLLAILAYPALAIAAGIAVWRLRKEEKR
jgi:hypothetical protein